MKKRSQVFFPIVVGLLGGLAGYWGASYLGVLFKGMSVTSAIIVVAGIVPAYFLAVAFHEAGHALTGVWVGFDFKMYVVGPFLWERNDHGLHFRWNRNVNASGGMVISIPVASPRLARNFALFAAGGPVASLLAAALLWVFADLVSSGVPEAAAVQVVAALFRITAFLSVFLFLITAIPFHSKGFSSDGARVFRLLRGGDVARFELLMLKLVAQAWGGVRYAGLDEREVEEAHNLGEQLQSPMRVHVDGIWYHHLFDRGDLDLAEEKLSLYLSQVDTIPKGLQGAVWLDAAFFYAYARKDLTRATDCWTRFEMSALIPKASVLATEAAVALLKGEREIAKERLEQAWKEVDYMLDKGGAVSLREKIQRMQSQLG
ncbi:MAG: hypothetical protein K1X47_00210 [Cyclobacteriaceae bacterium]|nr:hypothetical protein [Cyclobacteriaceae bacterium]